MHSTAGQNKSELQRGEQQRRTGVYDREKNPEQARPSQHTDDCSAHEQRDTANLTVRESSPKRFVHLLT
jgi:hypothetical protein